MAVFRFGHRGASGSCGPARQVATCDRCARNGSHVSQLDRPVCQPPLSRVSAPSAAQLGLQHGLDPFSPVDDAGLFTAEAGAEFEGLAVLDDGTAAVIAALDREGALLKVPPIGRSPAAVQCLCRSALCYSGRPREAPLRGVHFSHHRIKCAESTGTGRPEALQRSVSGGPPMLVAAGF